MKKVMLFIVSAVFSVSANAASFDFAAIADAFPGEFGAPSIGFSDGGIGLTATGTAGGLAANAYLDAGNAGLGVCKALDGADQCDPSNDDNVLAGEALTLTFDQDVFVSDVTMVNGGHLSSFAGTYELIIDGISQGTASLASLVSINLWGTVFEFVNNSAGDETLATNQFYIQVLDAHVPVPAALFLFAPALLGFFGLRRKATLAA